MITKKYNTESYTRKSISLEVVNILPRVLQVYICERLARVCAIMATRGKHVGSALVVGNPPLEDQMTVNVPYHQDH